MIRRNLSNNKGAMLALRYMAKCGLSSNDISRELHRAFNYPWSSRTVSRLVNCVESPPPSSAIGRTLGTFNEPKLINSHISRKRISATQTTEAILRNHFKNTNPDNLSFGELCNYSTSFFERLANKDRDETVPQEWWDTARDKVISWHHILCRTKDALGQLDNVQLRAYDYCMAMYTLSITGGSHYRQVYSLYREWRLSFISSVFGISLD